MGIDKSAVRRVLDRVKADQRTLLTAPEGKLVCDAYEIAVPKDGIAESPEPAAGRLGHQLYAHHPNATGRVIQARPPRSSKVTKLSRACRPVATRNRPQLAVLAQRTRHVSLAAGRRLRRIQLAARHRLR